MFFSLFFIFFSSFFTSCLSTEALMNKDFKEKKLKKIKILKTNNYLIQDSYKKYLKPKESKESLKGLIDYVQRKIPDTRLRDLGDPSVIIKVLEWVSVQWKHDGMNPGGEASSALALLKKVHENGARYRCVEYGFVHSEILRSLGYVTRPISLKHKEVAYGGFGMGHVASEVWSNTLEKWVFIDPQFSIYTSHEGRYLSFYDMFELKKKNKFHEIKFNVSPEFVKKSEKSLAKFVTDYKEFIEDYFGFMSVPIYKNGLRYSLFLPLESEDQHLTFQGMPSNDYIFTKNYNDLYPKMNKTLLTFFFKGSRSRDFMVVLKKLKISSNDDYIKNMPHFAPEPNLTAKLHHNMPNFSHFQIKVGEKSPWKDLKTEEFDLLLKSGKSKVFARSVNSFGVCGPVTYLFFAYDSDENL